MVFWCQQPKESLEFLELEYFLAEIKGSAWGLELTSVRE